MTDVFIQRTAGQTQGRLLKQQQLVRTVDVYDTVYLVDTGVETIIKQIYICNRTGTATTFRLHHDEDGQTFDNSNALYYDKTVAANDTFTICSEFYMLEGDSIGVSTDPTDNLTISVYGEEIQTRAR